MGCWTGARDGSTSKQGMRDSNRGSPSTRLGHALTREMAMERHKSDAANGGKMADIDANEPADSFDELAESQDELVATAATVAVVGAGVIIFEAALLPGLVLGIATMLVPKYLPRLGGAVSPLVKSTVRGAYKMGQKTREMVAEVQEQVHDIVAEVDAEGDKKAATPKSSARSPMPAA
jgi:hypothetical protein